MIGYSAAICDRRENSHKSWIFCEVSLRKCSRDYSFLGSEGVCAHDSEANRHHPSFSILHAGILQVEKSLKKFFCFLANDSGLFAVLTAKPSGYRR